MKKVILTVAIAFTAISGAFAQKQEGGEKNLEVNFSPLNASPIGMEGIRLRLFNSDGTGAVRLRIGIGGSNDVTVRQQSYVAANANKTVVPELYDTEKSFDFSIRPGYEIHFDGTDRLSPYVGAELLFASHSETLIKEFQDGVNATDDTDQAKWSTWEAERKNGTTTFGLNAVAGFDFYFADNLYLGAEIGFGFKNTKHKDQEITLSNDHFLYSTGVGSAQEDDDFDYAVIEDGKVVIKTPVGDGTGKFKNGGWGPMYQATLRLGWLF